jgi:hypothetical protein
LDPTLAQDVATKNYVDTRTVNSLASQIADYSANSHKFTNVLDPTLAQDASTKNYVDNSIVNNTRQIISVSGNTKVAVSDTGNITSFTNNSINTVNLDTVSLRPLIPIDMGTTQKIINLADATTGGDALNRTTADGRYYLNTVTLNSITAPSASLSINSQKIVNLLDPTLAQDAVTLNYLQTNNYTKTQTTALTVNSFAVPIASFSMNS